MKKLLIIPVILCFGLQVMADSQIVCVDTTDGVDVTIVRLMEKVKKLGYNHITSISIKKDGAYCLICAVAEKKKNEK